MKIVCFIALAVVLLTVCFSSSLSRTWYVKADGTGDASTIQAAVNASSNGDTVLVAPGTYAGTGNRNINVGSRNVVVASEAGPEVTIIEVQGSPTNIGRAFITGTAASLTLDGFTIQNGYIAGYDHGGGVKVGFSTATIENCIFLNNMVEGVGGAIFANSGGSYPSTVIIRNCTFDGNSALQGGAFHSYTRDIFIEDSMFRNNHAQTGGAMALGNDGQVRNCVFDGNSCNDNDYGAAVYASNSDAELTFESCVFLRNTGGTVFDVMNSTGPPVRVHGCTFYGNDARLPAAGRGAAITVGSAAVVSIENTIVAFSAAGQAIMCSANSIPTVTCTDIYDNVGGDWVGYVGDQQGTNGNSSVDPVFCSAATGDLTLSSNSPCLPSNNTCGVLIGAFGQGCEPLVESALIDSIVDIPNDQGGWVRIHITRSPYDSVDETAFPIAIYNVWRRVDDAATAQSVIVEGKRLGFEEIANFDTRTDRNLETLENTGLLSGLEVIEWQNRFFCADVHKFQPAGLPVGTWEIIGSFAAAQLERYIYAAPTLGDSSDVEIPYTVYAISAHTTTPTVWAMSPPDSGYSVDNLAPRIPRGLTGQYDPAPDFLTLHWNANPERDLRGYRVYRGEGPDFVPSDGTLIATTPDTLISSLPHFSVDPWYIKVSAVDIHGNESAFAVLPPEYVTIATLISSYRADWGRGVVEVSWIMIDEGSQFEFRVLRKVGADGTYEQLSGEIVGVASERTFRDPAVEPGKTYWYRVLILENGQPVTSFETSITTPPYEFALYQNYPNPFNPSTRIDFTLDAGGPVSLRIYDISGKLVRTVVDGHRPAAAYTEEWDGRDDFGNDVASGIYFVRLSAGNRTLTRKAVVVR